MILTIKIINGNPLSISYPKSIMDYQKKDFRLAAQKYRQRLISWTSCKDKKRKYQDHAIINSMHPSADHYLEKWTNIQEKR
jgi:hypothetical protein